MNGSADAGAQRAMPTIAADAKRRISPPLSVDDRRKEGYGGKPSVSLCSFTGSKSRNLQLAVDFGSLLLELFRLLLHAFLERLLFRHALLRGVVAHVLRDLH